MLKLKVLGSSSLGNCYILENDTEELMIECGVRYSKIFNYIDDKKMIGVLVSHKHSDHLNVDTLKMVNKPVYSNEMTLNSIEHYVGAKSPLQATKIVKIGGFVVMPFLVYHDVDNFGYLIKDKVSNHKVVFITDSSTYTNIHFKDIDTFIVEANNSEKWLEEKNDLEFKDYRTYSEFGHCSIEKTIEFLKENVNHNTKNIVLIHISSSYEDYEEFGRMVKKEFPKLNVYAVNPRLKEPLEIVLKEDSKINFD